MKIYEIQIPDRKRRYWESLEESNAHGLRLWSIACYLRSAVELSEEQIPGSLEHLNEVCGILHEINELHNQAGSLSPFLYGLRNEAREQLRGAIVSYFADFRDLLKLV